ncbi:glycerol-3-phosphate dehydrogenase [candidate division WOR-1 bacterium RIFCSPHIGHO2_01_FULL_53_15]|uniref:Glycerol-3-phosphate dehydrogenase [NAD(P)+] n=1 Tax=candidate division WOR-1 bacterium RIFCSPHIGHO2_01_FULL_53_15 TaxID=1802564 RepID=A0A1F4PZ08_UNCSA|nr:MAG: glycerol-3-phosphate dehydrogenase [candidate division WOR-1 bacterium RIFCSPHIGHO2_01_FULL_53_15]OGC10484.1 MAG: glycerol-3-phosphate dehydrogenase [candidate division WOR-1 bacterium RIFCSPHIGHO2_02_FULL_53_26]
MNISVIGAGAWGTTLAILLAENKHEVTLWAYEPELVASLKEFRENKKFLPGFPLGKTIRLTGSPQAAADAEIFFLAVPTQFLRRVAGQFSTIIGERAIVVCASKGIEEKTLKLPLEILGEELKTRRLCALSGPNLSSEIARGLPAATVVASADGEAANKVQACLMNERFRVYTNADPIGVQLGGALKNVIAIAAGVADGLKLGDNAKAGLLIRGMAEIARLGAVMGARPETFAGLSGMGDLITTCSSKLSRNHQVGEKLAAGMKLADILKEMTAVAEGAPTAAAARALGKKLSIPLPIIEEVFEVLYENKDPYRAISSLMARTATSE